jgi:hypothetical protein
MAGRREHRISYYREELRTIRLLILAICSFAFVGILPVDVKAQQSAIAVVAAGNAAVTGFSGALPPVQIAAGADPYQITLIDRNGPSLRVVDLQRMHGPMAAQLVGASKPFTFTAAQIGQVFGVVLDSNSPPNIYVAATSAYGLPIVAPGPDGQARHIKTGAPNATFMPGLWGPQGGPGSIWKIDGVSGMVSLFTNVMPGSRPNSGAALGALAFDPDTKSLFVADRESGLISRLTLDGRVLHRYDHGVTGRQAQGLSPVAWNSRQPIDVTNPQFDSTEPATWSYAAPERRIFGLAVFQHRLYYAVADGLQIWSVSLNADGSFGTDAVIELAVPPSSGPTEISTITFDEQGRMFLADRPAPTGAFDFEALAVPAIGRVLRYAQIGTTADGRRIWQETPDEYAIGFPHDLRNGNGGVAIGYNYDPNGDIVYASCGGFMWTTGEDLRNSGDSALAARLSQSGPLHVRGLQGNGTWRIRRHDEPPFLSYFINYIDEFEDQAARGHLGDIAIARPCTPSAAQIEIFPTLPGQPAGGVSPSKPGTPPVQTPGTPPNVPVTPPGSCLPNQVRNVTTGNCGTCPPPSIQVNGKCCSVASLAVNAACSNSTCLPGQTPIGPSNFCCGSGQVYTGANGAQACCSGQVVNGQCQPSTTPPTCTPSSMHPCCSSGYVPAGGSCCLASQMTSTGTCCPAGQTPSGPNKSQCVSLIPVHIPPLCCPTGQIPVSGPRPCCPTANVTTTGVCCSQPVDPRDRTHCPAQVQMLPGCAAGYTMMPDGNCCNDRFVSRDGKSCNTRQAPCGQGEFRDSSGVCVPVVPPTQSCTGGEVVDRNGNCVAGGPPPTCRPGEVLNRHGHCVSGGGSTPSCAPGEVRDRRGRCASSGGRPPRCPPGQVLDRRGHCVSAALSRRGRPGFLLPRGSPGRPFFQPGGGPFGPGGGFRR